MSSSTPAGLAWTSTCFRGVRVDVRRLVVPMALPSSRSDGLFMLFLIDGSLTNFAGATEKFFFFFKNGTGSRPWNQSTHWPARISVVPGREPVLYNTALKHIFWSFYWLTHWVRTMCSNYPRDIPCMTSSLTVYMPDLLQSSGSHGIPDQEIHLYLLPNEWISVHSTYFSRSTCINYRMKWPPWEDS